jgi:uncharacterized membrane protein
MPAYPYDPRVVDHGWWHAGNIVPIMLFAILIGVIVWAVLRLTRLSRPTLTGTSVGSANAASSSAALGELQLRYARGEIDREEFVQRFTDLGGTGVAPVPTAAVTPPAPDPSPTDPPPTAA